MSFEANIDSLSLLGLALNYRRIMLLLASSLHSLRISLASDNPPPQLDEQEAADDNARVIHAGCCEKGLAHGRCIAPKDAQVDRIWHTSHWHLVREREKDNRKDQPQAGNDVDRHAEPMVHEERAAVHGSTAEEDVGQDGDEVGEVVDRAGETVSRDMC